MSVVLYTNRPAPYEIMPEHFFENGEEGAFFIPRPKPRGSQTALYEDAGGMDPATESGDPVGFMRDLSGNGGHARQTVASARPTYQATNGRQGLLFDGVDDMLEAGQFDIQGDWLIALAFRLEAYGLNSGILSMIGVHATATRRVVLASRRQSGARILEASVRYGGSLYGVNSPNGVFDIGDIVVASMSVSGQSLTLRLNGGEIGSRDDVIQDGAMGSLLLMPQSDGGIFTIFGAAAIKGAHDIDKIERIERYLARLARTQL